MSDTHSDSAPSVHDSSEDRLAGSASPDPGDAGLEWLAEGSVTAAAGFRAAGRPWWRRICDASRPRTRRHARATAPR